MKIEVFKDVVGFEGIYFVSNFGNIKNSKGKIMKPRKDKDGYLLINLCRDKKSTTFKVHRLVAIAFIPNFDTLKNEVNHKDEVKSNNEVSNLEWCDHFYNNKYGTKPQRISDANSVEVFQFDLDGEFLKSHKSTRQIERDFGFKHSNISACCLGKYKTAYGSIWKYEKGVLV